VASFGTVDMEADTRVSKWAGADKFVMAGASHGGFITLEYALAHPEHLHGIIVGDSAANMSGWGYLNTVKTALTDPRVKCDPEQIVRMFSGRMTDQNDLLTGFMSISPLYAAPDHLKAEAEVNVDEVLASAVMPFWDTVNAASGDCISRYDLRDTIHDLKVPIFVYVGRHDWITPVMLSEEIVAKIPHAKFVIYEKSGHLAALEEKTKFQKDARDFISTLKIK
jgi:proline iminopeptidase